MAHKKNPTGRIVKIIVGLVLLLVAALAVARFTGLLGVEEEGIRVEVTTAEVRNITQLVTASGKVQPEVEVKISPDVSGEIIYLSVDEGDWVERGQLLVRIKPDFYQAQVEQADAGVSQAKANQAQSEAQLLKNEQELARQKQLFKSNAISASALETAQTNYDISKAQVEAAQFQVESAQARLREAKEQLNKTEIYAPMSGTVSPLNVEMGERVVGTSQMAGTEMMRIARLNQMELEVEVNENDVVNVVLGDSALIEVDAYPERMFRGVVTEIANSARVTAAGTQEQVTNFPVKVRILDVHNPMAEVSQVQEGAVGEEEVPPPGMGEAPTLRPGMSGTVDIFTETVFDAVVVPIQAVTVRDFNRLDQAEESEGRPGGDDEEGGASFGAEEDLRRVVFVVEEELAQLLEVDTGISDDTHIEIKSGLTGGESVIIGPYRAVSRELKPDMKVQIRASRPGGSADGSVAQR